MKRFTIWIVFILLSTLAMDAQQVIYASLKELLAQEGDTLTILQVQKRTKSQMNLMGGADYRISADDNTSLGRYLKRRCYAVEIDGSLYINCRRMKYKKYRFGNWYAPAMRVGDKIFYAAQPIGQVATETLVETSANKLRGSVGDAIQASGLINERVYYEIDTQTGRSEFVGRERMLKLLEDNPDLKVKFEKETVENAETIGRYLRLLK